MKTMEDVSIRRVGNGYIVSYTEVTEKGKKDEKYDYKQEVFLDRAKATGRIDELTKDL